GMQFDTTINDWHPCPKSGRINASNPCVTGDTLVATADGLVPIKDLAGRKIVQVVGKDGDLAPVTEIFRTGVKPVWLLRTKSGYTLRVTADHPIWTTNRGDVKAGELKAGDELSLLPGRFGRDTLAPPVAAFIGKAVALGSRTGEEDQVPPAREIVEMVDQFADIEGGHARKRLTDAAFRLDRDATAALLRG